MIKIFTFMGMMESLLSIVRMKGKCPICDKAVTLVSKPQRKGYSLVHGNEYYSHYRKGDDHLLIRVMPSEIVEEALKVSLC